MCFYSHILFTILSLSFYLEFQLSLFLLAKAPCFHLRGSQIGDIYWNRQDVCQHCSKKMVAICWPGTHSGKAF